MKIELTLKEALAVRLAVKTSVYAYSHPAWVKAFCYNLKRKIENERREADKVGD